MSADLIAPGVTIRWPTGGKIEHIPPDRPMFIVWRDQFGTVNATGYALDLDSDPVDAIVADVRALFEAAP